LPSSASVTKTSRRAKQEAETLIAEIERLFDQVARVVAGSDYGRDALEKAQGVIERTRAAWSAARRRRCASRSTRSRTLRMFKGVVGKSTDGLDGWSRSRPTATVPPPAPRPRSEHPPATRSSESTDSLRLVSARSRPSPAHPPDLAAEMNDRFALGDFTGALRAAELLLGQDPKDAEATQVATVSRDRLVSFYLARLGGLEAVLDLKVAGAEVRWLGLDHRAGFLLSCVDGTTTVEEIVDVSGMPKHEALRLLAELLDGGAVTRIG
jgi:hypothetical protein